ncbi:MBL fold metallo-hydrolase [Roseomonas marmotae]|uniref:MBL fold metallo-hydrolase n=1 Tax=Roseomonas marmotae TaxID=2768161 RepID=A0ABS3KE73_9PROT|nr:MBL fold metallo-hydrolase [Roseomonas marmotae]MBO1074646.1 MBL fold metallo-hydrolase [Roseomonas marmotae]QTI81666.1 MBL fold metallo-hydrolase [Roseomonas marmotae]
MRFMIGDARVDVVPDIECFPLPARRLLPAADLAALAEHRALLEPDHVDFGRETILLGVQALLLRLPDLTVLIDTCVGEDKPRAARPEWHQRRASGFLERLRALDVAPEDVDVVFCTHLHADHVGWNTRLLDGRWVPTFPRARYVVGERELAQWQARAAADPSGNHGSFADSVQPLLEAGQVVTAREGEEIAPGAVLTALPGHTEGQMGLRVTRQGARAIFCGDAIHSPVQILRPEWSSSFCADGETAATTRRRLLECAAEEDTLLVPAHFRHCGCTRIRRRGDAFLPVFGDGEDGGRRSSSQS